MFKKLISFNFPRKSNSGISQPQKKKSDIVPDKPSLVVFCIVVGLICFGLSSLKGILEDSSCLQATQQCMTYSHFVDNITTEIYDDTDSCESFLLKDAETHRDFVKDYYITVEKYTKKDTVYFYTQLMHDSEVITYKSFKLVDKKDGYHLQCVPTWQVPK